MTSRARKAKASATFLDRMNAERIVVAQECIGDGRWLLQKGIDCELRITGHP
jgi:acyl-CoA dehydrogenase